jgi:hypothetical protein
MESCLTQIDIICVVSFDIVLFYLSTIILSEILKFVYLQSTFSLAVNYMNSKHDSPLVMNMTFSNGRK